VGENSRTTSSTVSTTHTSFDELTATSKGPSRCPVQGLASALALAPLVPPLAPAGTLTPAVLRELRFGAGALTRVMAL
jgi:hypothetical protein